MNFSSFRCVLFAAMLWLCSAEFALSDDLEKSADHKAAQNAGDNKAAERFHSLQAFDAALHALEPKIHSLTSLQRGEVEKEFDAEVAELSKTPWTVPLVIKDVRAKDGELFVIFFKKIDDSAGKLIMQWKPDYVYLALPKAEALALKVDQVVYLTGTPTFFPPDQNGSGFSLKDETNSSPKNLKLTASSLESKQRIRPSENPPTRLVLLKDVKLTTE